MDHLGIQVDEENELTQLTERLKNADLKVYGEGETTCCYAESKKAWVEDPSGVAWETYQTMADAEVYNEADESTEEEAEACCAPSASGNDCC